jgi:predicted transglutaminase-like cysteine proteinase
MVVEASPAAKEAWRVIRETDLGKPDTRIRMNVTRKAKASKHHTVELTVEGPDGDWVLAEHKRLFAEIEADYPREE